MSYIYHDFLAHYGIPGMKWGVRRYQNKDGSLTNAGWARYVDQNGQLTKKGKRSLAKNPAKLSGNDVIQQWAQYANSGKRDNESTTPIVVKYQKEIDKIYEQSKRHISTTKAARIANKSHDWIGEISGAMLKDMGYKDTQKGRDWMKKQPWMTDLWTPIYV